LVSLLSMTNSADPQWEGANRARNKIFNT